MHESDTFTDINCAPPTCLACATKARLHSDQPTAFCIQLSVSAVRTAPGTMAATSEAPPFMKGNVIDGKAVAAKIREEIAAKVTELKEKYKRVRYAATDGRVPASVRLDCLR